jgi:hypothetical protein
MGFLEEILTLLEDWLVNPKDIYNIWKNNANCILW